MVEALHAEWTKLRTLASSYWLLVGLLALTVAVGALVVAAASVTSTGAHQDTTKLALTGIDVGQVMAILVGVAVGSGEYGSGMVLLTLAAVPRRGRVLAAKAAVVAAVVVVAGTLAVLASILIGRLVLPGGGFTHAHGYPLLSLAHGSTLRAAAGSVLYLGLVALLGLGVAFLVRDSGTAIGVVLGLLLIFPIVAASVNDSHLKRHIQQVGPMTAGLSIQATTGLHGLAISPWAGLGVLGLWAAGALAVGLAVFGRRDA